MIQKIIDGMMDRIKDYDNEELTKKRLKFARTIFLSLLILCSGFFLINFFAIFQTETVLDFFKTGLILILSGIGIVRSGSSLKTIKKEYERW